MISKIEERQCDNCAEKVQSNSRVYGGTFLFQGWVSTTEDSGMSKESHDFCCKKCAADFFAKELNGKGKRTCTARVSTIGAIARFKCWLFGHNYQWEVSRDKGDPSNIPQFYRAVCSRCNRSFKVPNKMGDTNASS